LPGRAAFLASPAIQYKAIRDDNIHSEAIQPEALDAAIRENGPQVSA